jgi:FHS family Na+ dependent glucose MFS transporter 1
MSPVAWWDTNHNPKMIPVCNFAQVGGWLLDKLQGGGHRLMVASLLALIAGTALQPSARSVAALACLTALQGLGMGFLDPCCNVLMMWLHGKGSAPWMQAMHCCFGIGALLSPLLVRAAQASSAAASYHSAFYAISCFLLLVALSFLLLASPPPPPQRAAPPDATTRVCCTPHLCDALRLLFTDAALLVTLVSVVLGIYVGAEVSYGAYVLVYAHQRLRVSEGDGQYAPSPPISNWFLVLF